MSENNKKEEEEIANSELYSENTDKQQEKAKENINEFEQNNSNEDNNSNINLDNTNPNENINENDEILIEVMDRGMNTDELSETELNRLVNENRELMEENNNEDNENNKIYNIEHDTKTNVSPKKKSLMEELKKNDEIYDLLLKSNKELNSKIQMTNKKYQDIIDKIEEKKSENIERKLTLKIKELEKEIKANNSETERYKKLIEDLKDKIDFQEGIDRASNIQKLLKQETLKNKELKDRLNTLIKINKYQSKYIENYDRKHKTQEKMEKLKSEIQQNKNCIKDYTNKFNKLDRFTKVAHEKILSLKMYVKKIIQEPKVEAKKIFTNEETKDTLTIITNLKNQIIEKRKELNNIQKDSDMKIHELLVQNKQIELEFIENEKINKNLVFKKHELNKKLRDLNEEKKIKKIQFVKKINMESIIDAKNNDKEKEKEIINMKDIINSEKKENESKKDDQSTNRTKDEKIENQNEEKKSDKSPKKKKKKKKEKKEGEKTEDKNKDKNNEEKNTEDKKDEEQKKEEAKEEDINENQQKKEVKKEEKKSKSKKKKLKNN